MSEGNTQTIHWSFWAITAFALLWNIGGSVNFFMQMDASNLGSYRVSERAIIEGRPLWATGGFAVAVFGGAIGGLLLLFRKVAATLTFTASLIGAAVTMIHTARIAVAEPSFGITEVLLMIIMPLLVAAYFAAYAKRAKSKGWLR